MTSFFSLPNMKAVCLCVWVWEQHYKYDFRISGSLRSTAIGCLFPPSPLVIFFVFFEGPDASMKEIPSFECSEGGGEITVLRYSSWHHEAKDRTSKQLSFSEPRASVLFESHINDAPCSSLIAVDEVDGLPSAEVLKMFSLDHFYWTSWSICYRPDFWPLPRIHDTKVLETGSGNLHFKRFFFLNT